VVAVPLVLLGLRILLVEWALGRRGIRTDATVVGLRHEPDDGGGVGDYYAQLRFVTADGEHIVAENRYGVPSYARFRPGSLQRVVYDPRRPQKVTIEWMRGRGRSLGYTLIGMGVLAIPVVVWLDSVLFG